MTTDESPLKGNTGRLSAAIPPSTRWLARDKYRSDGWSFLERLREEAGRGQLAALRRNVGESFDDARNISWLYRFMPRRPDQAEESRIQSAYFTAVCLFAYDKDAVERGMFFHGNFGKTLAWLRMQPRVGRNSLDRRFRALLDADFSRDGGGELTYRLRQLVRYSLSQGAMVDWPLLIADLCLWSTERRIIQKDWANGFYDFAEPAAEAEPPATDDIEPEN